jgi:hypothetical protein
MDRWAVGNGQDNGQGNGQGNSQGTEPPKSNYPSLLDGTLVTLGEAAAAFPAIPSVSFPTVYDTYELLNFGPLFGSHGGILTNQPPLNGPSYAIRLPKTDGDGIDLAGVHQIESRVPLGTSTGWNLRSPAHRGPNNLCVLTGSYFPFATTKAERLISGDPRPALQERYGSHEGFVDAVEKAAQELVKERFLLEADADADINAAQASTVLK